MATYKVRGTAHNVIYQYRTDDLGEVKQQWETYQTELEAVQRKAFIDYLQKNKLYGEITKAALDYQQRKAIERAVQEEVRIQMAVKEQEPEHDRDNMDKTYREFAEKWLPFHARKRRFSPNSYDSYRKNLDNHILPYFGDRIMSTITEEDIDDFLDYLSKKPCKGAGYGKDIMEVQTLSSASIKKCYTVLMAGFKTAKKWRYIQEIPETTPPTERTRKRHAWTAQKVFQVLESIKDDEILHLAVHLAFVCSLRAGETVGIDIGTLDFQDSSMWITRQLQRVSDQALAALPKNEIIRAFPKHVQTAKTTLILKAPKTEGSRRKQYLTSPLLQEIQKRLDKIAKQKAFFERDYHDYGLLLCQPDGRPIDPKTLSKAFKQRQKALGIAPEDLIEFHGLRKSGQMHKVRLSQNNYQLVAENSGQSPEVLMSNYNDVLDSEKRALSRMVEDSFYPPEQRGRATQQDNMASIMQMLQQDPELGRRLFEQLKQGVA